MLFAIESIRKYFVISLEMLIDLIPFFFQYVVTAHREPHLCGVSCLVYLRGHADLRMTYTLRQPACEKLQHPVSSYKISGLRK